ncbi:hypothetical protein LXL04_001816 [Taraxacum kok-saghyz]
MGMAEFAGNMKANFKKKCRAAMEFYWDVYVVDDLAHSKNEGIPFLINIVVMLFNSSVKKNMLGSFENSYIPENPRTPPISYISQTVIPFKKPTSEPSKTFRMNKIR